MLIDHIGAILFPEQIVLRIIGRIAFPIFAFLIVEGYFHTRDLKKYLLRLGLFAIISEMPFDIAFHFVKVIEFQSQNVFFTLFIALLAIAIYDKYKELHPIVAVSAVILLAILNEVIHADYGIMGVMIIFVFYKFKGKHFSLFSWLLVINLIVIGLNMQLHQMTLWSVISLFEVVALIVIFKCNGKKGFSLRYLFYVFYPGHLLLLHLISTLM